MIGHTVPTAPALRSGCDDEEDEDGARGGGGLLLLFTRTMGWEKEGGGISFTTEIRHPSRSYTVLEPYVFVFSVYSYLTHCVSSLLSPIGL